MVLSPITIEIKLEANINDDTTQITVAGQSDTALLRNHCFSFLDNVSAWIQAIFKRTVEKHIQRNMTNIVLMKVCYRLMCQHIWSLYMSTTGCHISR